MSETPAALSGLLELGAERRRLLAELKAVEDRLRPVVAEAVTERIPLRKIADATGLSVTTVRIWGAGG